MNVRHPTEGFERLVPKARAGFRPTTAPVRRNASVASQFQTWQNEPSSIEIDEDQIAYKIIVPLSGIDPRKIYVFATPRSLLIEIRLKSSICHELTGARVMERVDRRISRELVLPVEIEHGTTSLRVSGESLHITAQKSEYNQGRSWSQLIQFDALAILDLT